MESDPILDTLRKHITPATIQQMSASIGADPASTSKAINLALPALLGGLTRNASKGDGARALDRALEQHDGSILDNLGGLLSGAGGGAGAAILGHIFGARRAPVERGVGKATGLDSGQIARLLAMLAPIVMAALGRMKQEKGLDSSRLPEVLKKSTSRLQKDVPEAGGLASILDSDGDGQIADDIARIGSSMIGGLFRK
jgi:hypothetical protein